MQRFFNKQFNKKAAPILLSLTAVFLVVPHQAHAVTVGGVLGNLVGGADWLLGITGPLFEILILPFAATIMALAGNLMDTAINFGLHTAYIFSLSPAINMGWVIIRDLANILFIFILIYISLGTIVKASGFQTKKLLTQVIIAALLVNFSMFFTKAIIDVSNVFGNWLYGGIQKTLAVNSVGNPPPGSDQAVSLSGLIADRLGIAKYWASGGQTIDQSKTSSQSSSFSNSLIRLMVVLIATYIFAYCAILFMARSIELLILLVFAPIGFVGGLLPQTSKYSKEWWDELLSVAIFPVAFLLMLYIAMQFINSLSSIQGQLASMASPLEIAGFPIMTYFQYFLIIFLLQACLKIAKDNSGEMGKALGGLAGQLGKLAVGAAVGIGSGGAGLAMRATLGRGAAIAASTDFIQSAATKKGFSGFIARRGLSGLKGVAGSSFDLRGTGLIEKTGLGLGIKGKGFGLEAQKEGFYGDIKARGEEEKKFAAKFEGRTKQERTDRQRAYADNVVAKAKFSFSPTAPFGQLRVTEYERNKIADAIRKQAAKGGDYKKPSKAEDFVRNLVEEGIVTQPPAPPTTPTTPTPP